MQQIITTVGTSIFTNIIWQQKGHFRPIQQCFRRLEKCTYQEWSDESDFISQLEQATNATIATHSPDSAEIYSLQAMQQKLGESLEITLLCTDTILSVLAARLTKAYFEGLEQHKPVAERNFKVKFEQTPEYIIEHLNIYNKQLFEQKGLTFFSERLYHLLEEGYCDWINITGGYKVLTPYLTLFAQAFQTPMFYLFQEDQPKASEIVEVPLIPLDIQWSALEQYQSALQELKEGVEGWTNYQRQQGITRGELNAFVWVDEANDIAALNGVGQMFYKKYQQWHVVYTFPGNLSPYLQTKQWRSPLHKAIKSLLENLTQFVQDNQLLEATQQEVYRALCTQGGDNLNHTRIKNAQTPYFIAKYPSAHPEIRFLYGFDYAQGVISQLKIFDCRIGTFNHSTYVKEFEVFYANNHDKPLIPFLEVKS